MNRFGYLAETTEPQSDFDEQMYARNGYSSFGYNPYGYNYFGDEEESDDDDLEFGNAFGRMNLYNHFGDEEESESDDEESSFGSSDDESDDESDDDFGSSDFGKKLRKVQANAKKAMRLAHSEGISLKEAWAIVKGEKTKRGRRKTTHRRKKTSRKSRKTTRKKVSSRKHKSDAKKAMKLKHERGISLKQAWKIVKKERK